jgi:hypothetical protein
MVGRDLMCLYRPSMSIEDAYPIIKMQHKLDDMSFTWMDAVQPEFYMSDNEIFMNDPNTASENILKLLATAIGLFVGVGITHYLFISPRVQTTLKPEIQTNSLGVKRQSR